MGILDTIIEAAVKAATETRPTIERVLFNKPATIVFWSDGTKTVAKCNECARWRMPDGTHYCSTRKTCLFKPHVGLAVACARKAVPKLGDELRKLEGK